MPKLTLNPTTGKFDVIVASQAEIPDIATNYLKLDQTTPQTITASPILNWLTASQALMTDANKKLVSVDMDTQIKRLSFLNS